MKNLLVLRNETSLERSNEFFEKNSVDFFSFPISISKPLKLDLSNIDTDIFLVTSLNAYQAVKDNLDILKQKKVYCLNKHIADKLKDIGVVKLDWDNTKQLAQYIINNEKSGAKIVHLCADNANKLFYDSLIENGFKITEVNAYETSFVENFDENIINALKSEEIKYIMVFSLASIKAMLDILKLNNLDYKNYKIICFSKKMAQGLSPYYAYNSKIEDMLEIYLNLEGKK